MRKLCCCMKAGDGRLPRATPMPWARLILVSSVVFAGQFGTMLLFPFLPFMVQDFFPELSKQELGQKAGYLGSAYFIGNFAGSFMWGWISDIWGRRPALLCGMCGLIASELLFGFSQNFAWAVGARLTWGFLNGNLGVAKTYIAEICDDSNQARGFSVIGTTAGLGRLFGSVVGGFLARPASKYSLLELPFFCTFPYLLPCLVGSFIALLCLAASVFFLTETLQKSTRREHEESSDFETSDTSALELIRKDTSEDNSDLLRSEDIAVESDVDNSSEFESIASDTDLLVEHVPGRRKEKRWVNPVMSCLEMKNQIASCRRNCYTCYTSCNGECSLNTARRVGSQKLRTGGAKLKSVLTLLCDRRVLISTSLYGMMSFYAIISNEVFPLLMVTSYHYGGYNMDENEIGLVIMTAGILQLFWQVIVYPYIPKYLGYRRTLQVSLALFGVVIALFPLLNRITGPVPGGLGTVDNNDVWSGSGSGNGSGFWFENETSVVNATLDYCGNNATEDLTIHSDSIKRIPFGIWTALVLFMGTVILSRTTGFTSMIVLVSNSAVPKTRGKVNGIGQSLSALGRATGPIVGSLLFSWSENNGFSWPLNYHFTFYIIGVFSVITVVLSLFLPKSVERKRDTLEGSASGVS